MKNVYTISLAMLSILLFAGCSKDFLKQYDKRIIGTWEITDIDRLGIGSSNSLVFQEGGVFTFADDGRLTFVDNGNTYQGSWDIRKVNTNDNTTRTLQITAVDFASQDVRSEYFNDMIFTGTNRFKAFISSGAHTYMYHFVRK